MTSILRMILAILVVGVVNVSTALAQDYSTTNKKAIKKYETGKAFYDRRQNDEALEEFEGAVKADPKFIEAFLMMGAIYEEKRDYKNARRVYESAIEANPNFFPNVFYTLGRLEMENGDYADGKKNFEHFLKYNARSRLAPYAQRGIEKCEYAMHLMANPVPFEPKNLGAAINSEFDEYFPSLTADDNMILYTRLLKKQTQMGLELNEDFYYSEKDNNGNWKPSANMGVPINTPTNEGAPTISADGFTMIFTACHDQFGSYGGQRTGNGSCDLFYTFKVGDRWTPPRNLSKQINTFSWETQPSFSADGRTLYFVRANINRDGIKEPADIYVSELNDEGYWTKPVALNSNVNTPGHEASVLIHPDGQTLYFSSDGHLGMGGLDIFVSRKEPNGEWGPAKNLGYPINTHNDENSLMVNAKGDIAYFASDRDGGLGGLDLYSFLLPPDVRPVNVTYLKGTVFDVKTKEPLEASFELIDLETGDVTIQSFSNPGNGNFLVSLPAGKDYALNVSRNGYMFYSDNFQMGEGSLYEPFLKDIPLTPIEVAGDDDPGVVLKNVYFETSKFDLKPKSTVELDKLVAFLTNNPTIHIELSGHTDNRGTEADNQTLSENRAKAVRDYLIEKGIDAERLTAVGFGESRPIAGNDSEEGRAQNRRTEYKVTKK